MSQLTSMQQRLASAPPAVFSAWALVAAFSTYFCMYALRKPFAVGTYADGPGLFGVDLKTVFVIAQVLGYASSKFLGIKVVSEMDGSRRALALLGCLGLAELALVAFAVVPAPYNAVLMALNGLPLGMVWGLVFGFLEGRRTSDLLGAGLCASFILASGVVKAVGGQLLVLGIDEYWMPAATGALFLPPLMLTVWMLAQIPPPSADDIEERTERVPMDAAARRAFFLSIAPGLVMLVVSYVALAAFRDFRDNFARELWDALGYADAPEMLALSEVPVAIGALLMVAALVLFRDNRRALLAIHLGMAAGSVLVGGSTLAYQLGWLDPAWWMVLVGLGLYIGYVPYNCVLFDRLVAALGSAATAGFLIYVADSFGYLGSVGVMLYKDFGSADLSWLDFFVSFAYATTAITLVGYALSAVYFWRRTGPDQQVAAEG